MTPYRPAVNRNRAVGLLDRRSRTSPKVVPPFCWRTLDATAARLDRVSPSQRRHPVTPDDQRGRVSVPTSRATGIAQAKARWRPKTFGEDFGTVKNGLCGCA